MVDDDLKWNDALEKIQLIHSQLKEGMIVKYYNGNVFTVKITKLVECGDVRISSAPDRTCEACQFLHIGINGLNPDCMVYGNPPRTRIILGIDFINEKEMMI
jgi:predicted methyltransferase